VSDQFAVKRVTAPDIKNRKGGVPIVALTAYHAHTARIIDLTSISSWLAIASAW